MRPRCLKTLSSVGVGSGVPLLTFTPFCKAESPIKRCQREEPDKVSTHDFDDTLVERVLVQRHSHLARQVSHGAVEVSRTGEVDECAGELIVRHNDDVQTPVLR